MTPKLMTALPKYVFKDTTPSGHVRYRFRKPGLPRTRLPGEPGSKEFNAAYEAALKAQPEPKPETGASRTIPGTINQMIVSYYQSSAFNHLAPSTRYVRRWLIERFRARHGDKPTAALDASHLHAMLSKLTPAMQKEWIKMLRGLYGHAIATSLAAGDPSRGYKLPRIESDGYRRWEDDDITRYREHHRIGSKARLALELMLHTGLRKSDVIRLGPQHIRKGRIEIKTQKTGTMVRLPFSPELAECIAATVTGISTFLVTKDGRSYSAKGFGNYMRDRCNEAGLPECSSHGLRHAVGCRLAEAGATTDEIMAVLGHTDPRMSSVYTKQASRSQLAHAAFAKLGIRS